MIDYDFLDPTVLTGYVREVPTPATWTLNQFLPDRLIPDIEAAWDTLTQTNRAAKYRAWDSETPVGQRDVWKRQRVEIPPLGVKTVVGERERLMLERVRSGGDNRSRMVEAVYNEAEINTRAIRARAELARGDVLTDGKFSLSENGLTGIEADFGVDPVTHLVTTGVTWADTTNADPLSDLRSWADTYIDDTGEPPAYMVATRQTVSYLVRNAKVRNLLSSLAGTPTMVTPQQLQQLLDAWDLPRLVQYNAQIDVDGVSTRPIPNDRIVLLPQDPSSLGFTAWGVTAEALELASGQNPSLAFEELPGIVGVVMKEGDPLRVWTKVTAVCMPIITDPRRLMVADVIP